MTDKKVETAKSFRLEIPKDILKQIPVFFRGLAQDIVNGFNKADLDKNGQADVEQYGPYVIRALPALFALLSKADPGKLRQAVLNTGIFTDKEEAKVLLDELVTHFTDATNTSKLVNRPTNMLADAGKNVEAEADETATA